MAYEYFSHEQLQYMKAHITDDATSSVLGANIACLTLSYLAVVLRFLSRRLSRASFGADDWIILGALVGPSLFAEALQHRSHLTCCGQVFITGLCVSAAVTTRFGYGRHAIVITNVEALQEVRIVPG